LPGHARAVEREEGIFEATYHGREKPLPHFVETARMKRLLADLLLQILAGQVLEQLLKLTEWLNTAPWKLWFA